MDSIFKNADKKSCPVTQCNMFEPGCSAILEHSQIKMESAKPFNISISGSELGFEKTVCIKCENEGAVRVYDKLKLK